MNTHMNKKKLVVILFLIVAAAFLNVFIFMKMFKVNPDEEKLYIRMTVASDALDAYQSNYAVQGIYTAEGMSECQMNEVGKKLTMDFETAYTDTYSFYLGHWPAHIKIYDISLFSAGVKVNIPFDVVMAGTMNEAVLNAEVRDGALNLDVNEFYPTIEFNYDSSVAKTAVSDALNSRHIRYSVLLCILIDLVVLYIIRNLKVIKELYRNLRYDRKLILSLAKNDFKTKFAGSYFGIVWAIVQPLITIVVYWFVFQVGLRTQNMNNFPFVLWLMCGLVPWFYFSDALGSGTNALTDYSYLVKKVVFKIEVLPIVKILSALIVNTFFIVFIIVVLACYGYTPDIYTIQIVYYVVCNIALVMSLTYITSAVIIFFKDLGQIIGIILQIGIWITPILWDASIISQKLDTILKINPVYYIVNGFRDALLTKHWVHENLAWTFVFWSMVVLLYISGKKLFTRLQVHFADVL